VIYAYVLGKLKAGAEQEILNMLKNVRRLKKASLTYGIFDICIEGEFKTMEELDEFILNVIRKIPGIQETVTLIASKTVFAQPGQALSFG
jgi:DNA-binding Lrp family transcriptional regulator